MDEYIEMVATCRGGVSKENSAYQCFENSRKYCDENQHKRSERDVQMCKRYQRRVRYISNRAIHLLGVEDMAIANQREIYENKYHPTKNPNGKINLCTAENNICEDLLEEKLKKLEVWKPDLQHMFHYPVPGGYERTKDALTPYIEKFFHAKVEKDNIVMGPGCTAAYDMIAFCICDPGDYVLCAAPYYGKIMNDFTERGGANVIPVPFRDPYNPKMEVESFEKVFHEYVSKGETIRAIVIVNPQNPHGNVFAKDEVIAICEWASEHDIFIVIDEIFASSVYYDEEKFESFLSFRKSLKRPETVIWMWGFSKDLCMPGAKFCAMHCENTKITQCLKRLEIMQPCAPLVQDFLVNFLSDLDWLQSFHEENLRRLAEHCEIAKMALSKMGISYVLPKAAFYLYCDFREYLSDRSFAAEYALFRKLCAEGVYLSPGKFFADPEPGWMRLVFSLDKQQLIEGLFSIERNECLTRESDNLLIYSASLLIR
uniref:Aminotran_1_2 domain-containing protein n=1 Tax=Ascaris lumbricoides TaxID=6252 RepID=A0A0M3IPD9_ASCLU